MPTLPGEAPQPRRHARFRAAEVMLLRRRALTQAAAVTVEAPTLTTAVAAEDSAAAVAVDVAAAVATGNVSPTKSTKGWGEILSPFFFPGSHFRRTKNKERVTLTPALQPSR